MAKCCGKKDVAANPSDPCSPPVAGAAPVGPAKPHAAALQYFGDMIDHCIAYAEQAKSQHRPVVGIMCEYTPRELILAAGGVPVCLCGGSADTIPPAEEFLPANLCPLIKSTFGYHVMKSNLFLEMADLIVAETTCDGKKKMYELLAQSRPMYVLELPNKQDDTNALEHWRREMAKFRQELQRRFGVEITDARLREAIKLMNRERRLRRELAALMASEKPPMTGLELLRFKSSISAIPADLEMYEKTLTVLKEQAGACSQSPAGKAPVRVLLTGVPIVHGSERVMEIIESSGGLVVCSENCTGVKPILQDVDEQAADPLIAIADKYYHLPCSVQTPNSRRMELLETLVAQYRPQCIVEVIWQACLTYDVESARVKQLAAEKLHLPYLRICTDYSPSDSARIAMRVQALFETVRRATK